MRDESQKMKLKDTFDFLTSAFQKTSAEEKRKPDIIDPEIALGSASFRRGE